jgi:hypothetical protein
MRSKSKVTRLLPKNRRARRLPARERQDEGEWKRAGAASDAGQGASYARGRSGLHPALRQLASMGAFVGSGAE